MSTVRDTLARFNTNVRQLLLVTALLPLFSTCAVAQPQRLVVSVAASVSDAMEEIAGLYRSSTGVTVAVNAGGSNTLARQIVEGASASVFLSADEIQMDAVEKAGRIVAGTRAALLTNELVVIVPQGSPGLTLAQLLEGQVARLAMGEPAAVPAGVYGRTWLEHENAWARLGPKVVPFPTVRSVLTAVEAGRVDAGIVYATDALAARVRVIARLSAREHPYLRITYPVAVIKGSAETEAKRFVEFLNGQSARAVFDRRGFGKPPVLSEPKRELARVEG